MRLIRLCTAVLLVLSAAPLAACGATRGRGAASRGDGGTATRTEEAGGEQVGTPQTVDCPDEATEVDLPADFPAPAPGGRRRRRVEERDGGRTVVTAVVPAAEPDVLADLQAAYPAAGLTLTEGETEERDAESNFTGDGRPAGWGIRELTDCSARPPASTSSSGVLLTPPLRAARSSENPGDGPWPPARPTVRRPPRGASRPAAARRRGRGP